MSMTGAQLVVKFLERQNVGCIFGIPGGAVIPLYDALYDSPLKHVLTRHEQAAVHAADGYARVSGEVGVCICTSGPGATNAVTGLANAHMDSVPLVVLTGQVKSTLIGTDAFQEADIYGSSLPLVKHSFLVREVDELAGALEGAFRIASTGRPGAVLVDIPVDVQNALISFEESRQLAFPGYAFAPSQDLTQMDEAVKLLKEAERPVILAGGGVVIARASEPLAALAERRDIPVSTTLMGKGAIAETHPLSLGMLGMHGTPQANLAVSHADVILALGTRFSDRSTGNRETFATGAKIIHVDIDRAEFGKNIAPELSLLGDAGRVLDVMNERLSGTAENPAWLKRIANWREDRFPVRNGGTELDARGILERVREKAPSGTVVTTEVGQNQMWSALFWKTDQPGKFVSSGGLGTMGFGLPSALGASVAVDGDPVFCIAGDGSLLMNIQEFETCVRYGLSVKVILLNNGTLGMVKQWQELFFDERYAETCAAPVCDFAALARAFGAEGYRVHDLDELGKVLDEVVSRPGPALVECPILPGELVFPMVPAGGKISEFLTEDDR